MQIHRWLTSQRSEPVCASHTMTLPNCSCFAGTLQSVPSTDDGVQSTPHIPYLWSITSAVEPVKRASTISNGFLQNSLWELRPNVGWLLPLSRLALQSGIRACPAPRPIPGLLGYIGAAVLLRMARRLNYTENTRSARQRESARSGTWSRASGTAARTPSSWSTPSTISRPRGSAVLRGHITLRAAAPPRGWCRTATTPHRPAGVERA